MLRSALSKISGISSSLSKNRKYQKDFEKIQYYCMFIGYPRSGHTLVGSLLDAHPDMIIAHELDALKYIERGIQRQELFSLLIENSHEFTANKRIWSGYSYEVPNQWNGRYRELKVIGDKKGGSSTRRIKRNPRLLAQLMKTVRVDVKFIHVIRNPFDNISTISKRSGEDLPVSAEKYFKLGATVYKLKKEASPHDWLDIKFESFIRDPKQSLRTLCDYLGQDCTEDYLNDCARIVLKEPHRSRADALWSRELIHSVTRKLVDFPFLHDYKFDD